mmetsp:Transcript_60698/g.100850  ORF Transcript_60698/g.100850 Transcript_60698/m.100850 type:complete len:87 (+) Transcript_60698:651-911(+)
MRNHAFHSTEGASVDVRVVQPLLPFEPGSADWLSARLIKLATMLDDHFGLPSQPQLGSFSTYEPCESSRKCKVAWLIDAGLRFPSP